VQHDGRDAAEEAEFAPDGYADAGEPVVEAFLRGGLLAGGDAFAVPDLGRG
jgi:hypothetical protein